MKKTPAKRTQPETIRLTQTFIKRLEPGPRDRDIQDSEVAGLCLRVRASGGMSYSLRYRDEKGKRRRFTLGPARSMTIQQARDISRKILGRVADGENPQDSKRAQRKNLTLAAFLNEHYSPHVASKKSGTEILRAIRKGFAPLLGKRLSEISQLDIERIRRSMVKKGHVPASNRYGGYLRTCLGKAVAWGMLESNPAIGIEHARESDGRVRYLSDDERARLLQALVDRETRTRDERRSANEWRRTRNYPELPDLDDCEFTDYLRPLIVLAMNCGCRRGELFHLEWGDIDFPKRTLTVRPEIAKNGRRRTLPLNGTAHDLLTSWRKQTGGKAFVFPNRKSQPFTTIKTVWLKLMRDAGIKDFRFHDLRHEFASRLAQSGTDLNTIRALLGHSGIDMVLRYSHLTSKELRAAVEGIDKGQPDNVVQFAAENAKE